MEDYSSGTDREDRPMTTAFVDTTEEDSGWELATIGEVAEEFGFTLRALRFYEEKGLVSPQRVGNRRLYSPRERRRLHIIAQGKRIGLALEEIRAILRASGENGSHRHLEVALEKCEERVREIRIEQQELQESLQEALQVVSELKGRLKN